MIGLPHERASPVAGTLPARWNHGNPTGGGAEPPLQVHWYDPHTVVLRQSKSVSYEAPFLFLLFGADRAVLFDTGATSDPYLFPLRATVDELVGEWAERHGRDGYELVVAHTHGHGDHIAGDGQFGDRKATKVVGIGVGEVASFFGFRDWPLDAVQFELGGRRLEILGTPGHHPAAIAVYDPWTGVLLTGDTVYPGRLYVPDFASFRQSLDQLVILAERRPVTHVLGCHIEMTTTSRRDYPIGEVYQPSEPPLELPVDRLTALREAAHGAAARPGVHRFADFILYNGPCRRQLLAQLARSSVSARRRRALAEARRTGLELKRRQEAATATG